MRKISILLSILVLAAMLLVACGGEETSTNIPVTNVPPVTIDVTTTSEAGSGTATEAPTEGTTTETPGIPVTGGTNPARLSSELDFTVLGQDGSQIGDVDDMVLDLDNARISYVVVGAGGREVLVPWNSLALQTSTSGGQQNAFILQTDPATFNNAPAFDMSNLPKMGQPAGDWDAQISNYWQSGGASGGTGTGLATATAGTGTGLATSTPGTGTGLATSTPSTGTGLATATAGTGNGLATSTPSTGGMGLATSMPSTGTGTTILQGVVLASDILGSTVTLGTTGAGTGTGTGLATSTPSTTTGLATATAGTGTGLATSTPSAGATGLATSTPGTSTSLATATAGTGTGTGEGMTGAIEDMIIDTTTGDIMYIVLNTNSGNDQLIPVPLSMFGRDSNTQGFVLNADATMLQSAPTFPSDQFPDTTVSDWNSQFDSFWQNNSSGGSGTSTQATATATP